jgi:hypothetical protein
MVEVQHGDPQDAGEENERKKSAAASQFDTRKKGVKRRFPRACGFRESRVVVGLGGTP